MLTTSDVAHQDYFVVRELLKEIALTQQLDTSIRSFKGLILTSAVRFMLLICLLDVFPVMLVPPV